MVKQGFLCSVADVDASDGDGHHFGSGRFVRLDHDHVRRKLSGADNETRPKRPSCNGQQVIRHRSLSTTDEVDDFDLVTVIDHGRVKGSPLHDHQVVFHRDATGVEVECLYKPAQGERPENFERIAVERDLQRSERTHGFRASQG